MADSEPWIAVSPEHQPSDRLLGQDPGAEREYELVAAHGDPKGAGLFTALRTRDFWTMLLLGLELLPVDIQGIHNQRERSNVISQL